jgi:hypothetical protein
MPCSDGGWGQACIDAERIKKIDKLTEMLCRILTVLERTPEIDLLGVNEEVLPIDDEIGVWWEEHKIKDKERSNG